MITIINSFGMFLPYVFCIIVVGILYDMVLSAFRGSKSL